MRFKLFILFLLVAGLFCDPAFATHIVGGEFTYRFISYNPGSNSITYNITLNIYEDCYTGDPNAIKDDNPAFLFFFTGAGTPVSFGSTKQYDSIYLASPAVNVPPNFSNACVKNPPPTCLKKATFTKNYTLPYSPLGYTVVYQRCCRNGSIINIANPGGVGASYTCKIPPVESSSHNNSAVFKNYPPQIICINNPLVYDHSATDIDGDSLSYEFCTAYTGGKPDDAKPQNAAPPPYQPVNYIGSYSALIPMRGSPIVKINPTTGMISGTPNILGRFVVAVCCHEWRNGVIINTVTREFQFVVTNCSKAVVANIPQFSDEFNTYIVQCKGYTVSFKNQSTGGFAYHWNFGTGNAADTSSDFEPTFTYPDSGVYVVSLLVNKGTTCPDSISRYVKVFPTFKANYSYDGLHCPNAEISFTDLSTSTYHAVTEWNWSFGDGAGSPDQNPKHAYTKGGTYPVVLISKSDLGCIDTMKKDVFIENFVPFAGNDTIIVKGESINFNATGGINYTWTPSTHLNNPNISNPTGYYPDTTRLDYMVHITSANQCEGDDTMNVWVVGQPSVFVPSAFTPNGDGINDELKPIGIGYKSVDYFRVFNRWGQVMYESDHFKVGWDGRFNGVLQQIGTYFWQLKVTDRFGKEEFYKGDATLIR